MSDIPLIFVWDAEHSVMIPRRKAIADRQYVDGEEYRLGIIEERSSNSHAHFFSAVNEAWANLSDEDSNRFPTADILRKHCLIKAGYCNYAEFECSSAAEAVRLSHFLHRIEEYTVISVRRHIVRRWVAKSQSYRAMGKEDFAKSKAAVLDILSTMLETSRKALESHAEAHP